MWAVLLSCEGIIFGRGFHSLLDVERERPRRQPVCMHRIFRYALMALTCCSMRSSVVLSVILRFSPSSCWSAMKASSSASEVPDYLAAVRVNHGLNAVARHDYTLLPRTNSRWKLSNTVSSARSVSVQFAYTDIPSGTS